MMKEKFARWHVLCLNYFKRDWKKILIWTLGLAAFSGGYIPPFVEISKGQGLIGLYETMRNPAMISMVGPTPITDPSNYTLGAMYSHMMLLFCGLFAMIISALHVTSHTRKEEELGLTEIVRSFQVGRQANSLAVLIETLGINLILALVTTLIMTVLKVESITVTGIVLFSLSLALAGMIGAVVALVMSQIMQTSTGATGSSMAIIGLLYILRGATDVSNQNLSMMNPMGWTYLTFPFTENNSLPIFIGIIFCVVLAIVAFALEGGRDMGAGYLPAIEGKANAKKSLLSVPGLFFRLNRGLIISWLVAFVVLGAAYGSIYGDMQVFLESNEIIKQMFTMTGVTIEESFTSVIMMVMIGMVGILPIAIVNKLYSEEERMHLSQLYATKITRSKLYWTTTVLSILSAIAGIVFAVIGLGGTAIVAMNGESTMTLATFMKAGFNYLPSTLFFVGLSSVVLGYVPKIGKAVYVYLGYSFALNYFGGMINLPEWFSKTAIQSWIPRMPASDFEVMPFVTITLISVAMILIGYTGYIRRDMQEGA